MLAPLKVQVLAPRPIFVCLPRSSAEGQTWAASAWRHKPLLGEDNFPKRSSVHLTMVGDKPAAAAPSQPSSLQPEQQCEGLVKPSHRVRRGALWRRSRRTPSLLRSSPCCLVLRRERRPPAMQTALCMSPAQTARMTYFCI